MNKAPKKSVILSLCFLLPAGLVAAVFALCGICPFGDRSLGVMDMAHQYLSFLYSLRDILSGSASALYLPSMCLGGNMLGVAAYYLASPLDLLTCLFPRERLYEAVSLLYFLRVGLCGLTMGVYAGRRHGYGWRCLFPALAYALMAYMIAYSFNYLWQDSVLLLPLVALGIVRLTEGRGPWLYVISLAASLAFNFYIGYILCLFSVLFFLYELLSLPREARVHPRRRDGTFAVIVNGGRDSAPLVRPWRRVGAFALSSFAAGALAAVLLVPAFLSLSGGKASFSLSDLTLTAKFDFIELFSKLYPAAFEYEEIMPEGLPQIFCGTATVTLALLYFANGAVPRRRRVLTGCLLGILAVSFWVSALDLIWHGLNTPSWYNYRYSFLLSFLLAAAADKELTVLRDGTKPWHLLLPVGILAAVTAVVFIGREYTYVTWVSGLAAVCLTCAVCGGAYLILRPGAGRRLVTVLCAALLAVHASELAVNAKLSLDDLTVTSSSPSDWAAYVSAKGAAFDLVPEDGTLVRTESADCFDMNRCEPMLFGYNGVSHYGSTLSQKNLDFLDGLGLDRYTDLWVQYGAGVTAAADSLLGIRYLVGTDCAKAYTPVASTGDYTVWENADALPLAWTADEAFAAASGGEDCFSRLQALYNAAAPEVQETLYAAAEVVQEQTENFTAADGQYTRGEQSPGYITYTLAVTADGPLYGQIGIDGFPGVMVYVNNTFTAYYATAQTNGCLYLGDFSAGDTVTVKLQASAGLTISGAWFATEDADALAAYSDALSAGGCALEELSASHYTGSFTTGDGDELLVLTIPYDAAWQVTLDGQDVTPIEVQDCLMALAVTPGTHTVELRYIPAGLIAGGCISAVALAACVGVFLWQRRKRAHQSA